jgi:hypothetical protein
VKPANPPPQRRTGAVSATSHCLSSSASTSTRPRALSLCPRASPTPPCAAHALQPPRRRARLPASSPRTPRRRHRARQPLEPTTGCDRPAHPRSTPASPIPDPAEPPPQGVHDRCRGLAHPRSMTQRVQVILASHNKDSARSVVSLCLPQATTVLNLLFSLMLL